MDVGKGRELGAEALQAESAKIPGTAKLYPSQAKQKQ